MRGRALFPLLALVCWSGIAASRGARRWRADNARFVAGSFFFSSGRISYAVSSAATVAANSVATLFCVANNRNSRGQSSKRERLREKRARRGFDPARRIGWMDIRHGRIASARDYSAGAAGAIVNLKPSRAGTFAPPSRSSGPCNLS